MAPTVSAHQSCLQHEVYAHIVNLKFKNYSR